MANLNVIVFSTDEQKAQGLQGMKELPERTLYVFPGMNGGAVFHSRNVVEPFDISFLDGNGEVLERTTMVPPRATMACPDGTLVVVESKENELENLGFDIGRRVNLEKLLGADYAKTVAPKKKTRRVEEDEADTEEVDEEGQDE